MESEGIRTDTIEAYIRERTQIDGTIALEEDQADIRRILSVNARFIPDGAEVVQDGVEITGRVVFGITYVSEEGRVEGIEAETKFTKKLEAPGVEPGMYAIFGGSVGAVEEKLTDPRTIALATDADIVVWVVDTGELDVVMPQEQNAQTQTQTQDFTGVSTVETQNSVISVSQEADIPNRLYPVGTIIESSAFAVVRDVSGTPEGTHVDGDLIVRLLYYSEPDEEHPDSVLQAHTFILPIATDIAWEQRGAGENARVTLTVESVDVTPIPNELDENRRVRIDASILTEAELLEDTAFSAVTDAYIPGRQSGLETESFELRQQPKDAVKERTLRFSITLPAGYPPIGEVVSLTARPVVDMVIPVEDGAQVKGSLECDVIYVADTEDAGIYGFHATVPFAEVVPSNCDGVMNAKAWTQQVAAAVISPKEVDCRVTLNLVVTCQRIENTRIITCVNDLGKTAENPDYAVVMTVANSDDTLWNVAKRFGATVDEVVRINPYLSERSLKKGDRVMLYRKYVP